MCLDYTAYIPAISSHIYNFIQIQLDNLKNLILIGGQQGGLKEGSGHGTGHPSAQQQLVVGGDVAGVGSEDEGLKKRPLKKKVRDTW